MRRITITFLLVTIFISALSQDYDLIVTINGDSIACRIDSINKTHIYFEMKTQGKWIHTYDNLNNIAKYQNVAINKKNIVFKPGTSIIMPYDEVSADTNTLKGISKNYAYAEFLGSGYVLSVNYDRVFPISDDFGIVLRGGLFYWEKILPMVGLNIIVGNAQHSFEGGITTVPTDGNGPLSFVRIPFAYRYQGNNGLLLKATLVIFPSDEWYTTIWPGFSIGFSF